MTEPPRICLVSASGQNVFFGEILEAFGDALRERGLTVEESVDCFPILADDLVYLLIPHEYFPLVDELAHPSPAQLQRSVVICTEQPGTNWFEISCSLAARAGGVVDINTLGAEEMTRRGIAAEHAQMGYIPAWDAWNGLQGKERPIDMTFLGRHTAERAEILARCAPALERRRAAIYLTETIYPHVSGSTYFLAGKRRAEHLASSKVLLNIHQQDFPYLEWHRILSAALNGCVILSEHSVQTSLLEPGTHFVSAHRDDLPLMLEGLLSDPDRLRQISASTYELIRSEMPMSAAADVVLDAIERAQRNPASTTGNLLPPPPHPMPKTLDERRPEWDVYAEWAGEQLLVRKALKDVIVRTKKLERRFGQLTDAEREVPLTEVEELGPELDDVRVSVLLTVYNHADLIGDALRSAALSGLRNVEVVAVDDGSTDGSADAIRAVCAELPWLTTRLVRRNLNSGLPAAARNLAVEHSRGDLFFVLDADNMVLPNGMEKLVEALEGDPDAAFAYGILERFEPGKSLGLESWLDWDPQRLRHGNYIDAMAMIRRSALAAVGGYPEQDALAGWEDFALWVAMAEIGLHGVRVPDFIGRYRVSHHSMLSSTSVDHTEAWNTILRLYPSLARDPVRAV